MRLLCLGDNVVDRYVAQGVMYPGGNAVNVAVFAKRLGADAAYQGVLGSDEAGRLVLASLVGEGVDTSRVTVAQGPNAWADVELVEGDRLFLGSDKGVSNFRLTATHYAEVAAFDAVHTAYTALLEDQLFDLCTHGFPTTSGGTSPPSRWGDSRQAFGWLPSQARISPRGRCPIFCERPARPAPPSPW